MAEYPAPGKIFIPRRARPRFGRGAWEGSVVPASTPTDDMRTADPTPVYPPKPFPVTPVNVTAFSAGNAWRHFVQPIMFEWWNWRNPLNTRVGPYFVAAPQEFHRIVHRRMSRVRRLDRLVPTRRVIYDPQTYGRQGQQTGEVRASTGVPLPDFSYRRR